MSAGKGGGNFLDTGMRLGGKMFSSVSSFFIGLGVLFISAVAVAVILPYAGFMGWHHDNLQVGADKATALVLWEFQVVGAAYEGGTNVTASGFRDGQKITQKSLKTVNP